jgi:pyruvate/2-oxoacid:ferredoxin oxidoreductase beta subunit
MVCLIEAWEDQKDQYDTMKDFVDAFYASTKKSKKKKEDEEKTPLVKVNILVPSSSKSKEKKPSKYLEFLKQWRVINPMIKGKEAIRQGAAAWRDFKTTLDV